MRLSLVLLLLTCTGCRAMYHQAFHHRTTELSRETVDVRVERTAVEDVPGSDSIAARFDSPLLVLTYERDTIETWKWKRAEQTRVEDLCEGMVSWDSIVISGILMGPILVLEYLTLVPYVIEIVHQKDHATCYRRERIDRKDNGTPAWSAREPGRHPVAGAKLAAFLAEDGARIPLGEGVTSSQGRLGLRLTGLLSKPTRMKNPTFEFESGTLKVATPIPDPEAILACLQGADWRHEEPAGDPVIRTAFSATSDGKRILVRCRVANYGVRPLGRLVLSFSGEDYLVGRLEPGGTFDRTLEMSAPAEIVPLKVETRCESTSLRETIVLVEGK